MSAQEQDLGRLERPRGLGAVIQRLERLPVGAHVLITAIIIVGITWLDIVTGVEVSLSIFYLIPAVWATWFIGSRAGLSMAVISAMVWVGMDRVTGFYSSGAITLWNSIARITLFVAVSLLLTEIRSTSEIRRRLAFTDSLTNIANTRVLDGDLDREIDRLRRYGHPFTLAYIDLDNFKSVNDGLGHQAGDELLRRVALALAASVRDLDVVARLGGDEFAVLMPETGADAAGPAVQRVADAMIAAIHEAAPAVDGVGATVGAVVFERAPWSTDHAVSLADEQMYEGKRAGRGVVKIKVFSGDDAAEEPTSLRA
jgi:diguanylate cyclase (GGDEF)-like protein